MRSFRVVAAGSILLVCGCEVGRGSSGSSSSSAGAAPRPLPDDPSAPSAARAASPTVDPAAPSDPSLRCARPSELPGTRLYSASDAGGGVCAATTLATAMAAVHGAFPELQDITTLYDPRGGIGDGSYVYAFLRDDGGLNLVFKRGSGDCQSGCTDNTYWYFASGADCTMSYVGQSHPGEACIPADQQPRWGTPESVSPARLCGADNAPRLLPESTVLQACGSRVACDPKAGGTPLSGVRLGITQTPDNLAVGTVVIDGTGDPDLDGTSWPATIDRARVTVSVHTGSLPARCPESVDLELDYDFEGFGARHLSFMAQRTPDCDGNPNDYCKGGVETALAPLSE